MACDLQFTDMSRGSKFKGKTKVYRFNPHKDTYHCRFMVGFAGTASDIITVAEFFTFPDKFKNAPKVKNLTGLVLTEEKDIFCFDDYTKWLIVSEKYGSCGSGADLALGAMLAGKTPLEAVKIAGQHDAFTGMGYKNFKFE